ncbi:hypothetical protein [Bacillus cereus]|uniref:hypothetical protein n=1 Tax=Bacillus cereus TaxID=1396 RepID=UPI001D0D6FC9|nr:hypothetical protein [Bacillus cereus]MBE7122871.1 hypothetical protein [Bacillus cereus]
MIPPLRYRLKTIKKTLFLDVREHLALHRSGQFLFLPHPGLKQNYAVVADLLFILLSCKPSWLYKEKNAYDFALSLAFFLKNTTITLIS